MGKEKIEDEGESERAVPIESGNPPYLYLFVNCFIIADLRIEPSLDFREAPCEPLLPSGVPLERGRKMRAPPSAWVGSDGERLVGAASHFTPPTPTPPSAFCLYSIFVSGVMEGRVRMPQHVRDKAAQVREGSDSQQTLFLGSLALRAHGTGGH